MNNIRKLTKAVKVGDVTIGGRNPICIQSMTNTDTLDTKSTVNQIIRLIDVGCQMVRLATPTVKEALNLKNIRHQLQQCGYKIPLIADVHFSPKVAQTAALYADKVRINPGNYADKKQFRQYDYTDKEYEQEIERIAERMQPLLTICRQNGTALRIGVNHGSLSDRIVSRYGNTAKAMAQSAIEYIQICQKMGFEKLVLSLKSSDVRTMIESVYYLMELSDNEQLYPLHLGVTETGNGIYGRIKSAAGIGALLKAGFGDTIRVSLTEKPENEIPFAAILAQMALPFEISNRNNSNSLKINKLYPKEPIPQKNHKSFIISNLQTIAEEDKNLSYFAETDNGLPPIVVYKGTYFEENEAEFIAKVVSDVSFLLTQKKINAFYINNKNFSDEYCYQLSINILQSLGIRYSSAEFVCCPSCGRTQYDIETCFEAVKKATSHLKNLKIAVMGCIVNGPGEMADADYGIVGCGAGKVAIYQQKKQIITNIPQQKAVEKLLEVIENKEI
ncbi:MAG: (E)-4-hydroxy-3-methylbut-2-enyl-diphosphate synthase [Bacteroidales bacterium]|jgi:(E)-4-hydroxy-3-methylbut-2-enyl-diphosphate synthase|nr:(E)-4-hydroxy-3-methylbut-2-enyl-diphosphate synthase [Bacteroidales bacterium]